MRTISDLQEILFDTVEQLKNRCEPADLERARAIGGVAQVIINSAKVQVDHAKVTGSSNAIQFITGGVTIEGELGQKTLPSPKPKQVHELPKGTTSPQPGVLVHKLR